MRLRAMDETAFQVQGGSKVLRQLWITCLHFKTFTLPTRTYKKISSQYYRTQSQFLTTDPEGGSVVSQRNKNITLWGVGDQSFLQEKMDVRTLFPVWEPFGLQGPSSAFPPPLVSFLRSEREGCAQPSCVPFLAPHLGLSLLLVFSVLYIQGL